jgi:PIN domain nuclease of toxin-antitoxin system
LGTLAKGLGRYKRVRFLFDTQALLWAALTPEKLSHKAAAIISDESVELLVSAASAWEIATKVRLGKLPFAEEFEREFLNDIDAAGYTLLSIDTETALRAGRLVGEHGDPFDRMIAAQALALDIPVISIDSALDSFGVRRIW